MADGYDTYTNDYLVPKDSVHWKPPRWPEVAGLLQGFWASVKAELGVIDKCLMTGVSLQTMDGNWSGFNVAQYVSWESKLVGSWDLTEADVAAALALKKSVGPVPQRSI